MLVCLFMCNVPPTAKDIHVWGRCRGLKSRLNGWRNRGLNPYMYSLVYNSSVLPTAAAPLFRLFALTVDCILFICVHAQHSNYSRQHLIAVV